MEVARYGRMRLGRCVKNDLGYVGCFSDVIQILDSKCSGIRTAIALNMYIFQCQSLPPAYVVRREDNSFTLLVCPQGEGGGSGQVSRWGGQVSQLMGGSDPAGRGGQVQPVGGVRSVSRRGGSGPAGGGQVQPGGVRSSWWGGSVSGGGQHLAPSCGWYASCVHAGGLSCSS